MRPNGRTAAPRGIPEKPDIPGYNYPGGVGSRMTILAAALLAMAQADSNVHSDEQGGISIQKPPKGDEWSFKPGDGVFAVAHKVDSIAVVVEIWYVARGNNYGTKNAAEDTWAELRDSKKFKELQKTGLKQMKLPGASAGGVFAHRLDMTYKSDQDEPREWLMYLFNSRQTEHFYKVSVIGDRGQYAKHQREVDWILSTLKTFKPPKPK
jgi:hypothetical protein